jgi:arylsulfatase A-like enzyme/predicted negative regulator of RcsB-dependent stress response
MFFYVIVPRAFCVAAILFISSCASKKSDAPAAANSLRRLNLVVVTIDTLRPDHLHCYGYQKIETPNLDRLSQRGVVFDDAVTQTPLTPPSHASIFTGQYPNVHHVRNTGGFVLPSSARPLARILQEQGWDTAAFVSSAVLKKSFGFSNGFGEYDDQMPRPKNRLEFREDPERRAGDTIDRAVQWLKTQSGKPYFLWVHLYDPHLPYNPPAPFNERYKGRLYDGEIAYTDQQLGRLFEAVGSKPGSDKTIITVLSDHGESLSEHGEYTHGVFLYDSTLRIAFMMAGPGIPSGLRVKQQARSVDFLPTVLSVMGGKPPSDIQGTNLTPTFSNGDAPTDISYEETLFPKLNMGWSELRAIRTNHWKYIRAPKPELYDLTQDPHESTNIIREHPDQVQKLEAQLKKMVSLGGGGPTEKVETSQVDERTMEQLKSLGYLSGSAARSYELTGKGIDPKDRIDILKVMDTAGNPDNHLPEAKRIAMYEQALKEDPTNPSLYRELGGEYEKAGRYREALELYQTALHNGIEEAILHSRIADLSLRQGNRDEAIVEYEKAAQLNPADLESQTNLATAYLEKGRVDDAERVFQWVLTSDPDHPAATNGLGLVAIQKKDYNAALGYFERAVELDPDLVEPQMNLGLLFEMSGDRPRARQHFEMFLAKASPAHYANIIPKVKQELAKLQ